MAACPLRYDEATFFCFFFVRSLAFGRIYIETRTRRMKGADTPRYENYKNERRYAEIRDVGSPLGANKRCVGTCTYMQAHASALHGDV